MTLPPSCKNMSTTVKESELELSAYGYLLLMDDSQIICECLILYKQIQTLCYDDNGACGVIGEWMNVVFDDSTWYLIPLSILCSNMFILNMLYKA